jgi:hypothetical protein
MTGLPVGPDAHGTQDNFREKKVKTAETQKMSPATLSVEGETGSWDDERRPARAAETIRANYSGIGWELCLASRVARHGQCRK